MKQLRILITGGSGFVGSSLGLQIKLKYPGYKIIVLDNLKRRGSELNIPRLKFADIEFIHGDIRNKEDFDAIPTVDVVIEASAEPSVLAGIDTPPDYLINTNFNGTINCLNFAVKCKASFIFLSTSRIYPINSIDLIETIELNTRFELSENQQLPGITTKGINENFPLTGYRSLYGASKLASELMINEYHQYFGLKTIINRCGVLTGPWQMGKSDQGVVVLWVAKHFWNQKLKYIGFNGSGKQVRDILHVNDLFDLVDVQIHEVEKFDGGTFNVGGGSDNTISLYELTQLCQEVVGNKIEILSDPITRQADIKTYVTDNTKIFNLCNWRPKITPKAIIEDVGNWISKNQELLAPILK